MLAFRIKRERRLTVGRAEPIDLLEVRLRHGQRARVQRMRAQLYKLRAPNNRASSAATMNAPGTKPGMPCLVSPLSFTNGAPRISSGIDSAVSLVPLQHDLGLPGVAWASFPAWSAHFLTER